jgi:hypothetical protein
VKVEPYSPIPPKFSCVSIPLTGDVPEVQFAGLLQFPPALFEV